MNPRKLLELETSESYNLVNVTGAINLVDKNSHIMQYLDYYTSLKIAPNYAVLLNGSWGSGKTWFMKKYIRSKRNKNTENAPKFLSISLYGITSYDDIEKAFFKELHPVLASEELKLVGAILKGIVKSTIKVDLDLIGDKRTDATLTSPMPDVQLIKSIKDNKDCILVFDDLERCSIPIINILGYLNQLVENEDIKVIILANEDELLKNSGFSNEIDKAKMYPYKVIKEKLIGKTFEVQTDVDSAIKCFIDQLESGELKEFLRSYNDFLKDLFKRSTYNNLRHLRQTILDFERFYEFLPKHSLTKKDLIENILDVFFALSFEVKKGEINVEDIIKIANGFTPLDPRRKNDDDPSAIIIRKYNGFSHLNPIKAELWYDFFKTSYLDVDKMEMQIRSSLYYNDENTPDWKRLSEYFALEEHEFNKEFSSVYENFKSCKYSKKEIVVYVVSILLFLSENNIIDASKEDIIKIAEKNIENLNSIGSLNLEFNQGFYVDLSFNYNGLGKEIEEFKIFYNKIKFASESTKVESLEKVASDLLNLLSKSFEEFESRLLIDNYGQSQLYEIPILKYIDVDQFVKAFWQLPQLKKRYLGRAFVDRYKYEDFHQKLKEEINWLKAIEQRINADNQVNTDRLTKFLVEEAFLPSLNKAISVLEQSSMSS